MTLLTPRPRVVLVQGGYADAPCWSRLVPLLMAKGLMVIPVQCGLGQGPGDVAAVWRVIESQDEDVLLVGHSWDGAVLTDAAVHPQVCGAVYIAGGPDGQCSLGDWLREFPVPGGSAPLPGEQDPAGDAPTWTGKPSWFLYGEQGRAASPGQAPMPAQLAQVADVVAQAAAELSVQLCPPVERRA